MLDYISVGNQIAYLRKQSKFTQEELAEKLGISAQAISKWENGHTLPETALLPLLAELLHCSIDSILMPFAARDAAFREFARAAGKHGEFALKLYQKLKGEFDFTVSYDEKYHLFESEFNGNSAKFNISGKEDFIIRFDVETAADGKTMFARLPLPHCSKYMNLVDKMPENVKREFRYNDCKSCTCNCPYVMVYDLEGTEYKQCHFIGLALDSDEIMEHIFTLICAEHKQNHP